MAELNVFFNLKEREDFVSYCFNQECTIVPDSDYEDNSYYLIKNMEQYHNYMGECVGFFIINDNYKRFPLEMRPFEKHDQKKYYIRQRYGGPSIDFYTPFFAEKKYNKIGPGFISIYPFYYHYGEKFKPDNELRNMYNTFTSYIHQRAKRVKIGKKNYWVGNDSLEQVKKGNLEFTEMDKFDWGSIL